jgi:hypothetical protein
VVAPPFPLAFRRGFCPFHADPIPIAPEASGFVLFPKFAHAVLQRFRQNIRRAIMAQTATTAAQRTINPSAPVML